MRALVIGLIAISLGAGCAHTLTGVRGTVPRLAVIETVETDADRLLDYYAYMTELQGETLLREYQRVQRLFDTEPNDLNRMQMVMLLSSQSATFRDTKTANALLEMWLGDQYNTYAKLRPLALLFDNYLAEVRRLDEERARQTDRLNETTNLVARQTKELKAERQRTKELQQKLKALLEMEMNLIDRDRIKKPDTQ